MGKNKTPGTFSALFEEAAQLTKPDAYVQGLKDENDKLKELNKFLLDTLSLIKSEGGFSIDGHIGKRINAAFNKANSR